MWRKVPVWVGGREGKQWYSIPELMDNWIESANISILETVKNKNEQTKKRIEQSLIFDHIGFENIHPFIDGNGRIGRILLNWQRVQIGLPVLVIREEEKHLYYEWFK